VTDNQKEYEAMRYLVGERLRTRARDEQGAAGPGEHLDADTVASFIEGRVEEPGASLITSHLITCSQCRTATARTMHLECETEVESEMLPPDEASGRLRQFLDRLSAQVFPSTEGDVVFAYQDQSLPEHTTEDQVNEEPAVESKESLEK